MKRILVFLLCILFFTSCNSTQSVSANWENQNPDLLAKPTPSQIEWADCEIGAIIHLDINVFAPDYKWRMHWQNVPDAKEFNPVDLDTDQWVKAIKDMGGEYAVLVAKHCTGFSLWPTQAHAFSVASSQWKNGQGDIVKDFIDSCRKYNVRPGLYYSVAANGYLNVDNPGLVNSGDPIEQKAYNQIVETQLTELWSKYGDLFEIWFDGGVLPPEKGGPDIIPILKKFQSDAVLFQGPVGIDSLIRWVGNERGVAPYPCWNSSFFGTSSAGVVEIPDMHGNPDGDLWCPAEADFPLRKAGFGGGWFWQPGQSKYLFETDELIQAYDETVGRNSNMLVGVVINDKGLVPQADVSLMTDFGRKLKKRFDKPLATINDNLTEWVLELKSTDKIETIVIQEQIQQGERVRAYHIEAQVNGKWKKIASGSSIGHKRIINIKSRRYERIRLVIDASVGPALIDNLSVYGSSK